MTVQQLQRRSSGSRVALLPLPHGRCCRVQQVSEHGLAELQPLAQPLDVRRAELSHRRRADRVELPHRHLADGADLLQRCEIAAKRFNELAGHQCTSTSTPACRAFARSAGGPGRAIGQPRADRNHADRRANEDRRISATSVENSSTCTFTLPSNRGADLVQGEPAQPRHLAAPATIARPRPRLAIASSRCPGRASPAASPARDGAV